MNAVVPSAARGLLAKIEDWDVFARAGVGTAEFSGFGKPRGDGTRPKVAVIEDVDSYLVRAVHPDGRAFVAVWMRRDGKGWTLDSAWRGRAAGEWTPQQLTATQLRAYVAPVAFEEAA